MIYKHAVRDAGHSCSSDVTGQLTHREDANRSRTMPKPLKLYECIESGFPYRPENTLNIGGLLSFK